MRLHLRLFHRLFLTVASKPTRLCLPGKMARDRRPRIAIPVRAVIGLGAAFAMVAGGCATKPSPTAAGLTSEGKFAFHRSRRPAAA